MVMKKLAYVLMGDFVHTSKHFWPFLGKYFDYRKWQVCVFQNWDDVCTMTPPDVVVNFRDARFNWRQNTPNWYDSTISYQIADFVTKSGTGYVAVHAGLMNIPVEHPIRTRVLQGSVVSPDPMPLFAHLLVGKGLPGSPFDTFANVTFHPTGNHPVLKGVTEFTVRDEQYGVQLEENNGVVVLGDTTSDAAGSSIGAWAHEIGSGRAVGITLGHLHESLCNPMEQRLIANAINWCGHYE